MDISRLLFGVHIHSKRSARKFTAIITFDSGGGGIENVEEGRHV